MRPILSLLAVLLVSVLPATAAADAASSALRFVWLDDFAAAEQVKLTAWIQETHAAAVRLTGPLPMPVRVYFHRRDGAREPVPWAHTQRSSTQGVHFHVDPRFPLEDFRRDWTAPHELSHLILPYLGPRHAWFAEGFASYLQYAVMQSMGVLSADEARRRYRRKLERAERGYEHTHQPFVAAAPRLRAEGKYPVMYWGGAAYFMQVDQALAERGSSLQSVLRDYLTCCRRDRDGLYSLLEELDRLAGAAVFSERLEHFESAPGFPRYADVIPGGR
ncbi:MAG: hypothetical protein U5Q16_01590 [Gammaproteobacteria bacterium]|nr:hypothetical protein [Gammaproteobacteria bacterium]